MVMRVDTKTALQKRTERRGQQIARWVTTDKKLGEVSADTDPERLQLTLAAKDPATMDAIEKEVLAYFTDFTKVSRDGGTLVLAPDESQVTRFQQESVDQAMLVIRNRIDKWGVAELDVRKLGTDSIQISLPGRSIPSRPRSWWAPPRSSSSGWWMTPTPTSSARWPRRRRRPRAATSPSRTRRASRSSQAPTARRCWAT